MKERKEGILKHRKYTRGYITNGDLKLQRSSNSKKEQQLTSPMIFDQSISNLRKIGLQLTQWRFNPFTRSRITLLQSAPYKKRGIVFHISVI